MRVFCLLIILSFSTSIWAKRIITSQIHDIDYGVVGEDEILILLKSGHVAKLKPDALDLIKEIQTVNFQKTWLTFTLDDHRYIKKIRSTKTPHFETPSYNSPGPDNKDSYVPTTVENLNAAQRYFREGRRAEEESQCFNRAMVWSYEWWKKHSLKSMKILIFFTRNYIRRYDFEWWFHIAPYIHVKINDQVVERVMDLKYTGRPYTFRDWTNIFMRNNAECPVINKYSEYADFPYTGDCFIIRTNMYTYQPADLQMNEAWNYTKREFNLTEVKAAYLEAFDMVF
jgi:hypothetical protein